MAESHNAPKESELAGKPVSISNSAVTGELSAGAKEELKKLQTELWGENYKSLDAAKKENPTIEFPGTTIPADLEKTLQRKKELAEKRKQELNEEADRVASKQKASAETPGKKLNK